MIKYLALLCMVISYYACNNVDYADNRSPNQDSIDVDKYGTGKPDTDIIRFTYLGHNYIQFGSLDFQWGTHDPDCPSEHKTSKR